MPTQIQIISIDSEGRLTGLDHKKKGLNLCQFGAAKITRATDIVWNETLQMWQVKFLQGELAGHILCIDHLHDAGTSYVNLREHVIKHGTTAPSSMNGSVVFSDYDDAVIAEVYIIQAYTLRGLAHYVFDCEGKLCKGMIRPIFQPETAGV